MCFSSKDWPVWSVLMISLFPVVCLLEFRYHKNEEMEGVLRNLSRNAGNDIRTHLYSIGNSSDSGQPLWVLEITAAEKDKLGVPNVKLIGNMHGNEAGARIVLLHFIEFLIESFGKNETVTWLLKNTRIHILPTLNPDGFARAGTACASSKGREVPFGDEKVDLNRNFPDCFNLDEKSNQVIPEGARKYPNCKNAYGLMTDKMTNEAEAVVKWMEEYKFVLSAALHGGQLVANYPYDSGYNTNPVTEESLTPDDDVFRHLAETYSNNHPSMHLGKKCRDKNASFTGGITNGAKWYAFEGGMGDYNYAFQGCMELTVEISCCKYPQSDLDILWTDNKESLLHFCMQANRGVSGRVLDLHTSQPIEGAILSISGRNVKFQSSRRTGEFWRILLPESYELQITAEGYYSKEIKFNVSSKDSKFHQLTFLEIHLVNSSSSTTTTSTIRTTNKDMMMFDIIPQFGSRFSEVESPADPLESKSLSNAMNCRSGILLKLICFIIVMRKFPNIDNEHYLP